MKKLLVLALLLSAGTLVYADNSGAEAFATGFANALNTRMGGQPYQQPNYVPAYQPPAVLHPEPHYDVVNDNGTPGNYSFGTHSGCMRYVHNSGGAFVDCVWVGGQ